MKREIPITLIRHGKTNANEKHCYIGRTDEPLSETGKKELLEYKASGRYQNVGQPVVDPKLGTSPILATSPMLRCRQTAELIFDRTDFLICDAFKEIDFGIFEGLNYEQLKNNKDYQAWLDSNCEMKIPSGESKDEFCERCFEGFCKLVSSQIDSRSLTLVVHGGTIMGLLSHLAGGDYYSYQCGCGEGFKGTLVLEEKDGTLLLDSLRIIDLHKLGEEK